jgi:hypothetical protein
VRHVRRPDSKPLRHAVQRRFHAADPARQTQGAPERLAYATEFAAFHLNQIDSKLGRLIELMEKRMAAQS